MPVSWLQFSGDIGISSLFLAFCFAGAAILWWIKRIKRDRLWMPIFAILPRPQQRLPQIQFVPPPWLIFCIFSLLALALIMSSLKPRVVKIVNEPDKKDSTAIFVDLSASVSATVSIEKYRQIVWSAASDLAAQSNIMLCRSDKADCAHIKNVDEIKAWVSDLEFHNYGILLSQWLRDFADQISDFSRIVFISDRDAHSWGASNWNVVGATLPIFRIDSSPATTDKASNIFISAAQADFSPADGTLSFAITLARSAPFTQEVKGRFIVRQNNLAITESQVNLPSSYKRLSVTLNSSVDKLNDKVTPLTIDFESSSPDALTRDDHFAMVPPASSDKVYIYGSGSRERMVDDPGVILSKAFNAVGLPVDSTASISIDELTAASFRVFLLGQSGDDTMMCQHPLRKNNHEMEKIWIIPTADSSDYSGLCQCITSLVRRRSPSAQTEIPQFCRDITQRDEWVEILAGLGGQQIGGVVGEAKQALAMRLTSKESLLDMIVFTVPITVDAANGIRIAKLPLIVRSLLKIHGVIADDGSLRKSHAIPAIADIAQYRRDHPDDSRISNVPIEESMQEAVDESKLPPALPPIGLALSAASGRGGERQMSSEFWLRVLQWLLVILIVTELLYYLARALLPASRAITIFLMIAFAWVDLPKALARGVETPLIGFDQIKDTKLTRLAAEIDARTSIDFLAKATILPKFGPAVFTHGWFWSRGIDRLIDKHQRMLASVNQWLRRGGFLVIEHWADNSNWREAFTAKITSGAGADGWHVIPPDHELMRSFHLLDSLPSCGGEQWYGFTFDKRLAIVVVPFGLIESVLDQPSPAAPCAIAAAPSRELITRVFINLLMAVLATDYKRDQIHLPEILKRLR